MTALVLLAPLGFIASLTFLGIWFTLGVMVFSAACSIYDQKWGHASR